MGWGRGRVRILFDLFFFFFFFGWEGGGLRDVSLMGRIESWNWDLGRSELLMIVYVMMIEQIV